MSRIHAFRATRYQVNAWLRDTRFFAVSRREVDSKNQKLPKPPSNGHRLLRLTSGWDISHQRWKIKGRSIEVHASNSEVSKKTFFHLNRTLPSRDTITRPGPEVCIISSIPLISSNFWPKKRQDTVKSWEKARITKQMCWDFEKFMIMAKMSYLKWDFTCTTMDE